LSMATIGDVFDFKNNPESDDYMIVDTAFKCPICGEEAWTGLIEWEIGDVFECSECDVEFKILPGPKIEVTALNDSNEV
ncbi:MAG TPA: hypothetical protein ACFYD4_08435, partial [Candidatus Wunengus sp. YC61]|uniref:hypothetical protein n=1 Tax=Candidatus Wunengus sp. YC61 TaxID=3367698 RepID=UPI0040250997